MPNQEFHGCQAFREGVTGMDARCRIEMLGGLQVHQGARTITRLLTESTGALLAYHLADPDPPEALDETPRPRRTPTGSMGQCPQEGNASVVFTTRLSRGGEGGGA